MPRVLKCGDVMPGCTTVLEALDDADVMRKAVEHAKTTHKMATMPFGVTNKVKAAIKNK